MRVLATHAKDNTMAYHSNPKDLPTSSGISYGSGSSNASTWDADHIYGCIGDDYGYYPTNGAFTGTDGYGSSVSSHAFYHNITTSVGYALSEFPCPTTYNYAELQNVLAFHDNNITSLNYSITIQSIACSGSSGTFQLSFRDAKSTLIDATTTRLMDITFIIQSISTIGGVSIYYDTSSYTNETLLCDATTAPIVSITFLTEFGVLPVLVLQHNALSGGSSTVDINYAQMNSNTII